MSKQEFGFLLDLLTQLRLPQESIALALIYVHTFHRWQSTRSKSTLDNASLTLAAISLSAKSSEKPRRLREILVPAYNHIHPDKPKLSFPSTLYDTLRASLVNAELILLRILKFELRVTTPFEFLEDVLRAYVRFSRTDRSHPEDYSLVTDSLLGIISRATIIRALCNSRIATAYTARTVAICCVLHAAYTLGMNPLRDPSQEQLINWITDVMKEEPVDIEDCLADLRAQ